MELVTFHDRIYGKYNRQLFTFESTWDSFRPISGIGWNGKCMVPIDSEYKSNLLDSFYGYGNLEMKALCRKLTNETELENAKDIKDPIHLWRWYGEKNSKWWRDRLCVFTSACVERDSVAWKKYLNYLEVRAKTLRRPFKGRMTKRLLPK
jgi:hypothetical protein